MEDVWDEETVGASETVGVCDKLGSSVGCDVRHLRILQHQIGQHHNQVNFQVCHRLPLFRWSPLFPFWYPDWSSDSRACLNDGNEEAYMKVSPQDYLFTSVEACCEAHFAWVVQQCGKVSMGDL